MESRIGSRKRKEQPSESVPSGYARSYSNRSRNLLVKQKQSEATIDQMTSQVSVKDLRARRVFSPATIEDDAMNIGKVDLEADFVLHMKNKAVHSDLGVSEFATVDPRPSIRENDVTEIGESEQSKRVEEKHEAITAANGTADSKEFLSNSRSSITSLRGRRKVFKSPSSFSFGRLLPYLMDQVNDDSSNFEIIDATLPKVLKSNNTVVDTVACKDEEIEPISNPSKLTDGLISTVESSDFVQKSHEDVLNNWLKECEQKTPPDSDILGLHVKPTSKLALKSCSRKALLQTPTSFSHRRLLPFLMSVAGDDDSSIEQNQQPQTQQNEKSTTADEASNSPTSTSVPVDSSTEITESVTLVSNDNILDKEDNRSISQLELNSQVEAVKSDSCLNLEQSPPNSNSACVEETPSKVTRVNESQHQYSLQITETHVENIKTGILKRTPRGCRGICNCLNCTSFRLHAERSFEFSKNQMHDAEEVALELINDLSSLRNILETTYSNSNDTDKEKQVKEACEKALYKEQVARARLEQMNEDLSFHCRSMNSLLRPKVTFANKIEEKVIT